MAENKNITTNLILKQFNKSNAIAYNLDYLSSTSDSTFGILNKAYAETGKKYARLKMAINRNECESENCEYETKRLAELLQSPQDSMDFLSNILSQVNVTEEKNYDPNNNFIWAVINSILTKKPGFSKNDGYMVELYLLEDGSQEINFNGPMFEEALVLNSSSLKALLDSNTSLVSSTPDINKAMISLLGDTGVFDASLIDENKELAPNAQISEEFILKNPDGSPDYEIVDIGNGKGRNILQYDMDKIEKKATPFINAEVAGLLSSEQRTIAAWNVYISQGTSAVEDDQMSQDANAGINSWSYENDLPLDQNKKILFESQYKNYFMYNYLEQFTKNQLPSIEEDAAVFDLAEAKTEKAQKFMDDNELN